MFFFFPCDQWIDKSNRERELTPTKLERGSTKIKDEGSKDSKNGKENVKQRNEPLISSHTLPLSSDNNSPLVSTPGLQDKAFSPITVSSIVPPVGIPKFAGGNLQIQLISARNLAVKDSNGFSDPYCILKLLDKNGSELKNSKKKSKVIKKTLNPEWKETFMYSCDASVSCLEITCWDEDMMSDEFMGIIKLEPPQFSKNQPSYYKLQQRNSKDEVSGDILLALSLT